MTIVFPFPLFLFLLFFLFFSKYANEVARKVPKTLIINFTWASNTDESPEGQTFWYWALLRQVP